MAGKKVSKNAERHFVALVGYEGRIADLKATPRVWIIPYRDLEPLVQTYKGDTRCIRRPLVDKNGAKYEDAWEQLWVERAAP